MNFDRIKKHVEYGEYVYTLHAEIERRADDLAFYQIETALLNGEVLEKYPDLGLGESCLVLGFSENIPCGTRVAWGQGCHYYRIRS
jgi:hypothetical protein